MAKVNKNGTATAGATKEILPADPKRVSFYFRSKGDTFYLNFGADAADGDVYLIRPYEQVFFNKLDPFDIKLAIDVYCASASAYIAQVDGVINS